MLQINRKEVERYLGYRGINKVDDIVDNVITECIDELKEKITPRSVFKVFPLETDGERLFFAGLTVDSKDLMRNLKGCSEVVMMAATIGPVPDMLVRRSEIRDILRAYTYQAVGAAMVEAYVNDVNEQIIEDAKARGLFARPRFSPGYGDLTLELQKDFLTILNMPKTIGVTLSDSLLMTPTKSVTAVIGLSQTKLNCVKSGCEECARRESCDFSRAR